eukprot:s2396_g11.t1
MWRQRQGHFQHTRLSKGCAEIWFCYLFPLSFITASFLRPSTVASAVYTVLAFLALVLPASFADEPCRWHRLHLCICLLCGSLLIAAATLLILCRQAVLQPDAVYLVKLFFFGDANCHDKSNLLPEILAFVAAFLGWILGCYAKRMEESPAVDVLDNPLMSPRRLIVVALILFSSASLDFNLFALVYHMATLLIVLYWARAKRSHSGKERHWAELLCLRIALLTVCSAQVSSVTIFSLPGIPQFFSSPVARLLGLEVSVAVCWQNLSSFLLIQLLVWPAQQRPAKRLPTQTPQDRRTAEEAPSPLVPKYAEDQPVSHEKEETQNRGEHPDGDELREGSDMGASTWKSVANKANYVCGRALLPLFSMMFLFMVWPSLTTLPLLLAGFSLHHIPVERFPIVFFYGALVYEMLCSSVWFCYNIFCTMSDQPLSRVPYEFTWLERGGLQCYLRKGPADPEVRRYIFAIGQGLAVVATAACTRSRSFQEQQSPAGNPSRPCAGFQGGPLVDLGDTQHQLFAQLIAPWCHNPGLLLLLLWSLCSALSSISSLPGLDLALHFWSLIAGHLAPADRSAEERAVEQQLPESPRPVPRLEEALRNSQLRVVYPPFVEAAPTFEEPAAAIDIEFSRDFQVEILKARDPETLSQLVPDFLLHLANHPSLDSRDRQWHPRARIGRALRAGISARRVLDDEFDKQARSPSVPFRSVYICLRCIRSESGWWTDSYAVYWPCIEIPDPTDRVSHRPLSFADIQSLATGLAANRVLPTLCLVQATGDPPREERVLCYLVRCRSNGFLILLPGVTLAESMLGELVGDDGVELAVYKQVEVGLEDSRGRKFGSGVMFIADLSAECSLFFCRTPALRGSAGADIVRMKVNGAVARPASRSAWQVAEAWISEHAGTDELVQEYQTAESELLGEEAGHQASDSDAAEVISQLQAKVNELEAQVQQPRSAARLSPPILKAEPKKRVAGNPELFSRGPGSVAPAALEQLKMLAGPPPKRLSQAEEAHLTLPDEDTGTLAQGLFAEQQAGAIDDEETAAIMAHRRCQFAWLLSTFPEPDLQPIAMNRKRLSIKPYARLAVAPWVAGNVAYLRDLDFLENRLKGSKPSDRSDDPSKEKEDPPPRKPWKPKKKEKQSGKDGEPDATQA